jgi:hypothetical protein
LEDKRLMVIGGSGETTTEILDKNGWNLLTVTLPVSIDSGCAVLVGQNNVMVIGGNQAAPGKNIFNKEV